MEFSEGISLLNTAISRSKGFDCAETSEDYDKDAKPNSACDCCKRTITKITPAQYEPSSIPAVSPKQKIITAKHLLDAVTHPDVLNTIAKVLNE